MFLRAFLLVLTLGLPAVLHTRGGWRFGELCGRLVKKRLESQGVLLEVGFEYDSEAKLQYMVYPSGARVKYTYDDLARHTGLKNVQGLNETDIVNNLTYGAAGELKSMSWINNAQQWATQNWSYNNRVQMTGYTYGGPGGAINHSYLYSTTQNDGKLWRRQDNLSGEVVEYQYDSIHRLTTASVLAGTGVAGQEWGQTYIYDGFGNMKQKIGAGLATVTSFNIPLNSAKNGAAPAGDPGDIDNRILTGPNGESYMYAPDNKRIAKTLTGAQGTQWFLWVGGMRVGTYTHNYNSSTGQWYLMGSKEDLYVAGRRVAPSDRLGSDLTGGLKLMPYGEELQPPNVPNDRTKFATYHRDASGLDYADQRYYSPGTGRFMTSDPYFASGGAGSPNSWNRFAYVEGDPVNKIDWRGLYWCESLDRNVESVQDCIDTSLPNRGYEIPTSNAPSPDPQTSTERIKRSVAPGEHTNAQMAMLDGRPNETDSQAKLAKHFLVRCSTT
jgi:RHS repeat-associated protein